MARRIVIFGWAESVHIQRWVAGLAGRGYEIKLISLGGKPLPDIATVVLPRTSRFSYLSHARAAVREARAFKPDLVHVHYAAGFGHWGVKTDIAPLLVSVWGSDILVSARRFWYRPFIRRALSKATAVTATSLFLKEATLRLAPAIENKCRVIPFGVEIPGATEPLPDGPLRILYLKKHRAIYGPDLLLQAVARARTTVSDVSLTMAGDGPMFGSLQRLSGDLGIADCVTFPGMIAREQVYRLIGEHHVLAMPSRSESFGVAALEAAACGRPALATRVGGIPEVIHDGQTGVLVAAESVDELASALVTMAQDRKKLARMGREARHFVETEYRWEQSIDAMAELYERLLA